jgi:hypothetical protein
MTPATKHEPTAETTRRRAAGISVQRSPPQSRDTRTAITQATIVEIEGAMISTYRLKHPVRAVLHESEEELTLVTLPAGAVLTTDLTTIRSMVSVVWQRRHYSISAQALQQEADHIPQ